MLLSGPLPQASAPAVTTTCTQLWSVEGRLRALWGRADGTISLTGCQLLLLAGCGPVVWLPSWLAEGMWPGALAGEPNRVPRMQRTRVATQT